MALAELIEKLRTKKRSAERTAFGHYIEAVKSLASGTEIDADEIGHIIESAGKDESNLESDTKLQVERFAKVAERERNLQAVQDRLHAERDMATAQRALQAAYDKLLPSVDAAQAKVTDANLRYLTTMNAESWLAENILDTELLEREAAIIPRLQKVNAELKPLIADRGHLEITMDNAEFKLAQKKRSTAGAYRVAWFNQPLEISELAERVADLQSQLSQLDALIRPRQQRQRELQAEVSEIHRQKLLP